MDTPVHDPIPHADVSDWVEQAVEVQDVSGSDDYPYTFHTEIMDEVEMTVGGANTG